MSKRFLPKGTRVQIQSKRGFFEGAVISAKNFTLPNQPDDWYIELQDDQRGYVYWKQQEDGGDSVTVIGEGR